MTLIETSKTATAVRKGKRRRKPRPVVSDFAWGAAAIGTVIGCNEKQTFHLIYSHVLDGAVKKVNGMHVGFVPKLRALMGGE
jgi:hypothetical protein